METIRTLKLTNGSEIREVNIVIRGNGSIALLDPTDTNRDSLVDLADDSDTSVADAVRDNGWEIVDPEIEAVPARETAFDYGYAYAEAMQGEDGFDTPVDIAKMLGSTQELPEGDYRAMREAGIEPDAREYWEGFNSFFDMQG